MVEIVCITIYISGVIIAFWGGLKEELKKTKYLTLIDVLSVLMVSLLSSWFGAISQYGDKIILFRKSEPQPQPSKKVHQITFRELTKNFPKDTMWVGGTEEIIGYSPKKNLHIIIEEGMIGSITGDFFVHKYCPKNKQRYLENWNKSKYPWKYLDLEDKIFEGFINLL